VAETTEEIQAEFANFAEATVAWDATFTELTQKNENLTTNMMTKEVEITAM